MKIYTRTGDKGTTSLIGGRRVAKHHPRIEAYGTVDELLSWIGLIRDSLDAEEDIQFLTSVQDRLMTCASQLALDDPAKASHIPEIIEEDILDLERQIDRMEEQLPPLGSFILPGGTPVSSQCHIARSVCRRAERECLRLAEEEELNALVLKYLNRLADFLFVFARKQLYKSGEKDFLWKPKL